MDVDADGTSKSAEAAQGKSGHDDPKQEKQQDEEPFLRFRLTYIDTVQSSPLDLPYPPTADDKSTPFIPARRTPFVPLGSGIVPDRVPELRIFGATEAGQKCCVHVHGAMPYVYVEYEGTVTPDHVHNHINRLARAINACMAASLNRRDPNKSLFVAFIVPVKAIPFYGFHVGYRYFLKIYCLDPKFMTRLATLLRSGEIMQKKWIVYESHIPYHLQFMLDSNLYGCGWVGISKAKFREPVPDDIEISSSAESADSGIGLMGPRLEDDVSKAALKRRSMILTRSTIPSSMLYARRDDSPPRIAHSALEFDIHVSWIMNRHLIKERNLHSDFTEFLNNPIPDDFKFVHSVRELWEDERRRRKMKGLDGPMEVSENSAEELLGGLTAGPRSLPKEPDSDARMYGIGSQPPWQRFNENNARFQELLEKDRLAYAASHPTAPIPAFETFARKERKGGWMEKIQTAFQSVEALFEETLLKDEEEHNPFGAWAVRGIGVTVSKTDTKTVAGQAIDKGKSRASSEDLDVNPQYLAMLSTQAGRARLAQMEDEEARVDAYVEKEGEDGNYDPLGEGQDEIHQPASDEEELGEQDLRREMEEHAKARVKEDKGKSREEAWEDEEVEHDMQDAGDESELFDAAHGQDLNPDEGIPTSSSRIAGGDAEMTIDEMDPDLALLNQLMPKEEEEDEEAYWDGMPSSNAFAHLRDGLPQASTSSHLTPSSRREKVAKEMNELKAAGAADISFMELSSEPMISSPGPGSPASAAAPTQARPDIYTPKKRSNLLSRNAPPSTTPSPTKPISPKKPSPSKLNYFSPAKSKLRNAVINPAFVAESRAKRKREDDLIGFRAIGDHGRTKLQQMLQVVSKPRPKITGMLQSNQKSNGTDSTGRQDPMPAQGQPENKKARLEISELSTSEDDDDWLGGAEADNDYADNDMRLLSSQDGGSTYSLDNESDGSPLGQHEALPHIDDAAVQPFEPFPYEDDQIDEHQQELDLESTMPVYAPARLSQIPSDNPEATDQSVPEDHPKGDRFTAVEVEEIANAKEPNTGAIVTRLQDSSEHQPQQDEKQLENGAEMPCREVEAFKQQQPTARVVRFASIPPAEAASSSACEIDGDDNMVSDSDMEDESSSTASEADQNTSPPAEEVQTSSQVPLLRLTSSVSTPHKSQHHTTGSSQNNIQNGSASATWQFARMPPRLYELLQDLETHKLPQKLYQDAYWSNAFDIPSKYHEYAGRRYVHKGDANAYLVAFEHQTSEAATDLGPAPLALPKAPVIGFRRWEYAPTPPTKKQVLQQLKQAGNDIPSIRKGVPSRPTSVYKGKSRVMDTQWAARSQIQGPTQANAFGVKFAQVKPSNAVVKEKEHMSSLAIEIHVNTRGELLPDPAHDEIQAIFYCFQNEDDNVPDNGRKEGTHVGFIATEYITNLSEQHVNFKKLGLSRYSIEVVEDEIDIIKALVDKVREWDPEIFTGYDVLKESWGYLVERAEEIVPEFEIITELSRVRSQSTGKKGSKTEDRWGYSKGATLKVTGRHIMPVWRLLKSDANLTIYSLENVAFHILRQRVPRFAYSTLTQWYTSSIPYQIARVLQHYLLRVQIVIELLDEAEIVTRNAEFARVYGVDFYSVLTRGSQFKVESFMFKISKPENFMLPSPSREDVGKQNAAECIPLILEPESGFYSSPVLVFDFQSLYPSVMIAYNLCYSTCLGRLKEFLGTNRLGTSSLAIAPGTLSLLKDWVTLSPNGLMFLKPQVRRSLLAKMLTEILDTRVMVKKSMKFVDESDKALGRLLNARQLGLKFIANVTYGYTSATFSGRMPCVEIADAIVQTGRETLERAKNTIQSRPDWGAVVRYGDTDSLFVHLPGKTKDEAFRIGNDIAETITKMNPKPVKLKFEKVYLPSFLLAKKRYVGFKYESPANKEPEFDAKGIETVRRDGFPAMQKMLETCIKILFRTSDLSQVKLYVQQQFSRIMQNRTSPQDFIYAKEVKMGSYSDKLLPPPGAVVTGRRMLVDPRAEALYGERVPYIISKGLNGPKAKQAHRALTPEEFVSDRENYLDDDHYIGRIVKTLNRLFLLVGVDVQGWRDSTPRIMKAGKPGVQDGSGRVRVDQHFSTAACPICGDKKPNHARLCESCAKESFATNLTAQTRIASAEQQLHDIMSVCATCSKLPATETGACNSTDCPTLYTRLKAGHKLDDVVSLLGNLVLTATDQKVVQQQQPYIIV